MAHLERFANNTGRRTTEMKAITQTFNKNVRSWGKYTTTSTRFSAPVGVHKRELPADYRKLSENVKEGYRSEGTESGRKIYAIGFNFPIQGVMIHYGAGRGQGGQKGSRWENAQGIIKKTNPNSLGKAGTGNRRPRNWFNAVVKNQLPALEQTVQELFDNAVLNATNIYIKDGITDK